MPRFTGKLLILAAVFCVLAAIAAAQDKAADKPAVAAASGVPGVRGEFLDEVAYYEQRFTRLAEAIPADKYTWRPAEGVRSIGEVYAHVVSANYGFAKMLGTDFPAGVDPKGIIATAGDKGKIVQELKDSFAHMRDAIQAIKDSDLDKSQKLPGNRQSTVRGTFIFITGHYGEHLGQSIAYARQIGIVPPWTEERMKQEAAKPKQ
jgi:uncharacterized damage-inducible protein DinB